jgi:hypothetical protein
LEDVMTDKTDKEELAALRREVDALKAAQPKPQPSREDQERATAKWIDDMHQLREGRMRYATPPSVVRYFADQDDRMVKEIALRDARAPTGRPGMIPTEQGSGGGGGRPSSGDGTGWVEPMPLSNPPGTNWVDAQCIADEVRQRAELKRKLGE